MRMYVLLVSKSLSPNGHLVNPSSEYFYFESDYEALMHISNYYYFGNKYWRLFYTNKNKSIISMKNDPIFSIWLGTLFDFDTPIAENNWSLKDIVPILRTEWRRAMKIASPSYYP